MNDDGSGADVQQEIRSACMSDFSCIICTGTSSYSMRTSCAAMGSRTVCVCVYIYIYICVCVCVCVCAQVNTDCEVNGDWDAGMKG